MKRVWIYLIIVFVLIVSCQKLPEPANEQSQPTQVEGEVVSEVKPTISSTEGTRPTEAVIPGDEPEADSFSGMPLPADRHDLFSASGACASCHQGLVDQSGADVSMDRMWRSSMMANAARDPYWQATVRSEITHNPEIALVIEEKCATCHTPMARFTNAALGEPSALFGSGYLMQENELHTIGMDGVSCNLCHQVMSDNFGEQESFSGGFLIDTKMPAGERIAFGPFPIGKQMAQVMKSASGFEPVQGMHVEQSELCGTCHTLYTPYLDSEGEIAGVFPEQNIYNEWLASEYVQSSACQGCHMPLADGAVQLSITGGPPRQPFYQHFFVGGNAYMMDIFQHFGSDMDVTASSENYRDTRASIVAQMSERTAELNLEDVHIDDGILYGAVHVQSLVGHKFPAGFPSRRTWLHIQVLDVNGEIIFESGAVNEDGSIIGNDNDTDATSFEPHYQAINDPGQVQIFESIMIDTDGQVTTILLRGANYIKDNRLLPRGFDPSNVDPDVAVYGLAAEDPNFQGGEDILQLMIDLTNATGPFIVRVELLFQSIGFRWADNLRSIQAEEPERFIQYYDAVRNLPLVVDSVEVDVE